MPGVTSAQVRASVYRGLGIRGDLSSSMNPSITFSPTLGIAAGRIEKLGLSLENFKEPLEDAIRKVMLPSIAKNFDEGGRPDRWEPLSEATDEIRGKQGSGDKILVRTGDLKAGASSFNIWSIQDTSAIIADLPQDIWYGKIHQGGAEAGSMKSLVKKHGGDAKKAIAELDDNIISAMRSGSKISGGGGGRSNIPARPFLVFQDEDEDDITQAFVDWLMKKVIEAWPPTGGV